MYTKFEFTPGWNLKISLTEEGKEELKDQLSGLDKTDEQIFIDLIEYHLCNGYYLVNDIQRERVGALTDSLIIADSIVDEDTTDAELEGISIFWFPNYMVQSYLDGFQKEGYIIFTKS